MAELEELHHLCRRHRLRLGLHLLGPTGHRAGSEPIFPQGSLAIRVLVDGGDAAVGRCQSDPGRETIDELARSCLALLERKGLR